MSVGHVLVHDLCQVTVLKIMWIIGLSGAWYRIGLFPESPRYLVFQGSHRYLSMGYQRAYLGPPELRLEYAVEQDD